HRHGWNSVRLTDHHAHALLVVLVERVNGCERWRLPLRRLYRSEHLALRRLHFPLAAAELIEATVDVRVNAAVSASIKTLAVYAHAGCNDEPLNPPLNQRFEKYGCAKVVYVRVSHELIHALADTDDRYEMVNSID